MPRAGSVSAAVNAAPEQQNKPRAQRRAPTAPAAAPAVHGTPSAARTVTVACKITNGLILQLCRMVPQREQTPVGVRDVMIAERTGTAYIIAGPAYPVQPPPGYPRQVQIEGGYALTRGIPKDFWDQWLEQNKDAPFVKNGHVFAQPTMDSVIDQAQDGAKLRTGFEPLDVSNDGKNDSRMPRSTHPGVSAFKYQPPEGTAGA
jgi:hypothetical protein